MKLLVDRLEQLEDFMVLLEPPDGIDQGHRERDCVHSELNVVGPERDEAVLVVSVKDRPTDANPVDKDQEVDGEAVSSIDLHFPGWGSCEIGGNAQERVEVGESLGETRTKAQSVLDRHLSNSGGQWNKKCLI